MRILLLHDYGTPTGGAENQMLRLRELLRERGHTVKLFTTDASLAPGAPVLADATCAGHTGRWQSVTSLLNFSAYRELQQLLQDFRPDVVHVRMFLWQLSPLILPLLRKIPAVYQVVTYKCICPSGIKVLPSGERCQHSAGLVCWREGCLSAVQWPLRLAQLRLWQHWRDSFQAIVTLSQNMKKVLEENGLAPVEVIYNGVRERPARTSMNKEPQVVFAGRLAPEKGLAVLFAAARRLWDAGLDFELVVAGDGPLRSLVEAEQPRVRYLGYVDQETLERELSGAWVQAIPSLWDEPFGNVATEAMMRGVAVVTSAAGGLAEIVQDGVTGYHVPPNDAPALARRLGELLGNRELCLQMGQQGRVRALAEFREENCVQAFEELYERIR
jgi:glycosyltransferase involved in cell wall biosynthesis